MWSLAAKCPFWFKRNRWNFLSGSLSNLLSIVNGPVLREVQKQNRKKTKQLTILLICWPYPSPLTLGFTPTQEAIKDKFAYIQVGAYVLFNLHHQMLNHFWAIYNKTKQNNYERKKKKELMVDPTNHNRTQLTGGPSAPAQGLEQQVFKVF